MKTLVDRWSIPQQLFWLREQDPEQHVQFDEELGLWNVYGYQETLSVFDDPATFASDVSRLMPGGMDESFKEGDLTQLDGPGHLKLRRLVSRAFTPRTVAELEPRIGSLTHELLDEVAGQGRIDLVEDLAYSLPVIVIADLLGVPSSDRHLFKKWMQGPGTPFDSSALLSTVDGEESEQFGADREHPMRELQAYLREHAAECRKQPRQDLLSQLVQAEVDGERLSDNEVVNFAGLLLTAGHITTTMLLGNTVLCLDTYPDQAARVRQDRSAVPAVIEESLRFLTPLPGTPRCTTTEVELGGQRIPQDQMIMAWAGAANRDARQFERPHVFDPTRGPNPHLGFGRGIHFCMGAGLARLEGRIALNILLDRFPLLRTDPDNPPVFLGSPYFTGPKSLPLLTQ